MAVARPRLIDTLSDAASALVEVLDADACAISRVLGDVLVLVTDHAAEGRSLLVGQGYLVSEYPETQQVLASGQPRTLSVSDPEVDPAEARVLAELGFSSLLMLPLELSGEPWGLVEVYRSAPQPFGAVEMRAAAGVLSGLG
jgi:GAF domain-containing protein